MGEDTKLILNTYQKINENVNTGFERVHKKIDHYSENCNKKYEECDDRVIKIEKKLAVKRALCEERKEAEKKKRDFWTPVSRAVIIAGALALLVIAGKLLIFGIGL